MSVGSTPAVPSSPQSVQLSLGPPEAVETLTDDISARSSIHELGLTCLESWHRAASNEPSSFSRCFGPIVPRGKNVKNTANIGKDRYDGRGSNSIGKIDRGGNYLGSKMSRLTPCGGCKGPVGSVHTCPCGVSMHPFCGKGIGEEGYGQSVVCPSCQSAAPPPPATAAAVRPAAGAAGVVVGIGPAPPPPATAAAVRPAAGAAGVVAGIGPAPPTPVTPAQGLSCDYAIYAYQLACSWRPPPRICRLPPVPSR